MAEKRSDTELLRDQMTREVSNDAYAIASTVFSKPEPDVSRVSNEQIDQRYRQAFASGDRQYLMSEAQRDPKQFLESVQRLGVMVPDAQPAAAPPQLPVPRTAQAAAPLPPPPPALQPQALPMPAAPPAIAPPSLPAATAAVPPVPPVSV